MTATFVGGGLSCQVVMMASLELLEPGDEDHILRIFTDDAIARFTASVPANPTREWAKKRIERANQPDNFKRMEFKFMADGCCKGLVSFFRNDDGNLEIGYAIGQEYRGGGLAQKALRLVIREVCLCGYSGTIYANCAKDNPASVHILEKTGFVRAGSGRYHSNGRGEGVDCWTYVLDV